MLLNRAQCGQFRFIQQLLVPKELKVRGLRNKINYFCLEFQTNYRSGAM